MEEGQGIQSQPIVSVVIPAHNEEKWIATCLESVLRKDAFTDKEVIVVDDASTDRTNEILSDFPVAVIRNDKPVGPSSARNIGVREARGRIVVFIDAHCIVEDAQWIGKILSFFRDPEVGAVAGYFKRQPSRWGAQRLRIRSRIRVIKSANAAYRKSVFEQVGGFDPSIEWAGDKVLTFKIHRSGWKVVHSREIQIVHAEKLWSLKRATLYGSCFFPLLKRYPREMMGKSQAEFSCMGIGLLLTLGLIIDLLYKPPVFTLSFLVIASLLNGAGRDAPLSDMIKDGFYSTVWAFAYYLGAILGVRKALV